MQRSTKTESPSLRPSRLLFRALLLLGLWAVGGVGMAGTIGFKVSFTGDDVSITHTGNEAAYRLRWYTLSAAEVWQPVAVIDGHADYLAPGQSLRGRRVPGGDAGLGAHDPLLLMFLDQAGSQISQLAWRRPPGRSSVVWPVSREAGLLRLCPPNQAVASAGAGYVIAVPGPGVRALALPFASPRVPPNPVLLGSAPGACQTLDTGPGQAAAWLLHASAGGALRVQLVPDGEIRGQAHQPKWLAWARRHLLSLAGVAALVGVGLLLLAILKPAFWRRQPNMAGRDV